MFVGINDPNLSGGCIRVYKYPSLTQYTEYSAHNETGIRKMRINYDDHYIITAGGDGCIMVFEVKDKEARGLKQRDGFTNPSTEIMITKGDLDDIKTQKDILK